MRAEILRILRAREEPTITVRYACGHEDQQSPAGDSEAYKRRIEKLDCPRCAHLVRRGR